MRFTKKIYGDPLVNQLIAELEGQRTHTRPYAWKSGDKLYSHITGGLILPTFDIPGYLLTIGCRHESLIMDCLDEYESDDPYTLIAKAQEIQTEYGPGVIQNWWGNPESLMPLINEKNIKGNPVFISAPLDSNQTDDFQIYVARVKVALSERNKTLMINDCNRLRNHIMSFVEDKTVKPGNHPAIYICGALLHTLLMVRPWETAVETTQLIPASTEAMAQYENEQAERMVYREVYGGAA